MATTKAGTDKATSKKKKARSLTITGTLTHFIFSPKGHIEGLFVATADRTVQVVVPPEAGDSLAGSLKEGRAVTVVVSSRNDADNDELHAVHTLIGVTSSNGKPFSMAKVKAVTKLKGRIARLNYAKHGEPNGVVLESGEFIHTKPDGMARAKVGVGDVVSAEGTTRAHVLGGLVMEASKLNGKKVGKR